MLDIKDIAFQITINVLCIPIIILLRFFVERKSGIWIEGYDSQRLSHKILIFSILFSNVLWFFGFFLLELISINLLVFFQLVIAIFVVVSETWRICFYLNITMINKKTIYYLSLFSSFLLLVPQYTIYLFGIKISNNLIFENNTSFMKIINSDYMDQILSNFAGVVIVILFSIYLIDLFSRLYEGVYS